MCTNILISNNDLVFGAMGELMQATNDLIFMKFYKNGSLKMGLFSSYANNRTGPIDISNWKLLRVMHGTLCKLETSTIL